MAGHVSLQGLERFGEDRSARSGKRVFWVVLAVAVLIGGWAVYHYFGAPTTPSPVPAAVQPNR
jgi:hypothetical protein